MSLRCPLSLMDRHPKPVKWTLCSIVFLLMLSSSPSPAADGPAGSNSVSIGPDPFLQVDHLIPAPSDSRLASGAPGPKYWQQKVSYKINATLDEDQKILRGREWITYENHSPHTLTFLWLQMDVMLSPQSQAVTSRTWKPTDEITVTDLQQLITSTTFDGSMKIGSVKGEDGSKFPYFINKGLMRVDLPQPLNPGDSVKFEVTWEYLLNNTKLVPSRTGYEVLDDGQVIFALACWYPRLCAYTDYGGWRLKQFIRYGEFTLEFGDFDVSITVPADHVVGATGALVNEKEVLTQEQLNRVTTGDTAPEPVFVVTKEEAAAKRAGPASTELATWRFQASNVRDFAFATSRAFLWHTWGCPIDDRIVRCVALFPSEGMPLWDHYACHAIAQTIEVYSEVTGIPYPWPHSTSVMGVHSTGMEWPMINFNGPRPEKDGSYSEQTKQRVIGVIIHETGHNWFPMIINSDERHWMWLDEGMNRFVEGFAHRRWDEKMNRIGHPRLVANYLVSDTHQPIMTHADHLHDVSQNAYLKASVGLTMLRETILGRELFDFAFKEYCRRWAFRRAQPADLFRTMENASGMDLDWFWRGWYMSTAHCDMDVTSVTRRVIHSGDPAGEKARHEKNKAKEAPSLTEERDKAEGIKRRVERYESLRDFYDTYDPHAVTEKKQKDFQQFLDRLTPDEKEMLAFELPLYEVRIKNHGELPMPVILQLELEDGSKELRRYPAEIWRLAKGEISLLLVVRQPVKSVTVDPYNETADPDMSNNTFPRKIEERDLKVINPEKKIENPLHEELEQKKKEQEPASEKTSR